MIDLRRLAPLLLLVPLAACTTNPTTGRRQFTLLSHKEEAALGIQAKPQLVAEFGGEMARADIRGYVSEVGGRLLMSALEQDPKMADLPWEFTVLDSDVINAFALPGGKVFMSRGLAQLMTNEAQLAGVLGHEVGHVMARHTNERFSRAAAAQVTLGIGGSLLGGSASGQMIADLAGKATSLTLMSYDRGQETESDRLGVRYMVKNGYDPRGQVQVMEILRDSMKGARQPEILSTHPLPESRIRDLQALIARDYPSTQNNPAYSLREQEFRDRFLARLRAAYPNAGPSRLAAGAHEAPPEGAIGALLATPGTTPGDGACTHP
jgi:predicted Zn-dependent protease